MQNATTLDTELLLNAPVVTASGVEQSRALAPANVVTWERDELRRHGWTTLAQVLANTPGLYVIDDLVIPSLGVRGVGPGLRGGSRIVRVMINGIQVNFRPDLTAFLGQEFIPFATVERIEIVKGPLSALYGANAFLATVNVITRQADSGFHGELGINERVMRGKGGFGFGGQLEYGNESLGVMVGYDQSTLHRSGLRITPTFPAGQAEQSALTSTFFNNPSRNDDSKPRSLYASFDLRGDTLGTLKLQGGRQELKSSVNFQPSSVLTGQSQAHLINDWASAQYALPVGESLVFAVNGDFTHGAPGDGDVQVANGEPDFTYTRNFASTAFNVGASATAQLPARLSAKIGLDYAHDREDILYFTRTEVATGVATDINGDGDLTETIANAGFYGQIGGNPIENLQQLSLMGNIRVDSPNLFDTQISWRTGVTYEWSQRFTSKLFVGQAFQTPSAVQLFARPGFGIVYNTVGNLSLSSIGLEPIQPQRVFSTELASTFALTDRVVVEGSLYYQKVIDKIEFIPVTGNPTTNYTAVNLSDQEFLGGELGLRANTARFSGYLNGSTQMLTNRDQDGSMTFRYEAPREFPLYTVLAGLTTRVPEIWTAVDVVARVVGPRASTAGNTLLNDGESYELPSYAVFDLTLTSLDVFIFGDNAETRFAVSLKNVFDNHFTYPSEGGFDIPNIGRNWYIQISQTF